MSLESLNYLRCFKMNDIDNMDIHRQMDQFDDGALRFSEKKYKEINISDEEDYEDEDVKEESILQSTDDRRNGNGNGDNCCSELKQSYEDFRNEVASGVGIRKKGEGGVKRGLGDSHPFEIEGEWMSKLEGKDMKTLCLEDLNGEEVVNRRVWLCSKEGHAPKPKNGREVPVREEVPIENENSGDEMRQPKKKKRKCVLREIKYSRTGCLARFVLKLDKKRREFYATVLDTEHNHDMCGVSMRHILRSFRHVTREDIVEVEALLEAGVSISGAYDYMANQTGGSAHVGFLVKDLYNKLNANKKKNCGAYGDAECFINWMRTKGREEKEFFCRYTKDGEGRLTNVYWRDFVSLMDYNAYGDVLVIDSTYQTNVYEMPLVLFVGANNHRASVVFGCALVSDEKEETYNWVFEKFLESMKQKLPISVVTDGCESIHKGLHKHMPKAHHRLCSWHIGRNIGQNIRDKHVKKELAKMIYSSVTVAEWEAEWDAIVKKHELKENSWVTSLHEKRKKWADAHLRGKWYGGIYSTQRCEGMNGKMKKKVGKYTTLLQFVSAYVRSLDYFRDRQLLDTFKSQNHTRHFESYLKGIQEDAFNIFTDDIYLVIKGQIKFAENFFVSMRIPYGNSHNLTLYVSEYDRPLRRWCVCYISNSPVESQTSDVYYCSCKQFESDGIVCPHILTVMKAGQILRYPTSLICEMWKKSSPKSVMAGKMSTGVGDGAAQIFRYSSLIGTAKRACVHFSRSAEGYDAGKAEIERLLETSLKFTVSQKPVVHLVECDNVLRDPLKARTKGMSSQAVQMNRTPAGGPKCGICYYPGHNARTCPDNPKNLKKKDSKGANSCSQGSDAPVHNGAKVYSRGQNVPEGGSSLLFCSYAVDRLVWI